MKLEKSSLDAENNLINIGVNIPAVELLVFVRDSLMTTPDTRVTQALTHINKALSVFGKNE